MRRYDYMALHRDFVDPVDVDHVHSGPNSIASTLSSASDSQDEFKAKYERLQEAYKRLQRNNISLEEKLLNVGEKFSADKNLISRDLATQTQKVVEAKFTIQQLNKENTQLKSDLKIALTLLQNKPNTFINQKLGSLPSDLQCRVREYSRDKDRERVQRNGGQRISVQIPHGSYGAQEEDDEAVSAAILAKVLEQRERERSKDKKFCIDIGTQTHEWIFPDALSTVEVSRRNPDKPEHEGRSGAEEGRVGDECGRVGGDEGRQYIEKCGESDESGDSRDGTKTSSSKSQSWESDFDSESSEIRRLNQNLNQNHVSNILLASAGMETRGGMEQEERRTRENEQIINTTGRTVNQQIKNQETQLRLSGETGLSDGNSEIHLENVSPSPRRTYILSSESSRQSDQNNEILLNYPRYTGEQEGSSQIDAREIGDNSELRDRAPVQIGGIQKKRYSDTPETCISSLHNRIKEPLISGGISEHGFQGRGGNELEKIRRSHTLDHLSSGEHYEAQSRAGPLPPSNPGSLLSLPTSASGADNIISYLAGSISGSATGSRAGSIGHQSINQTKFGTMSRSVSYSSKQTDL